MKVTMCAQTSVIFYSVPLQVMLSQGNYTLAKALTSRYQKDVSMLLSFHPLQRNHSNLFICYSFGKLQCIEFLPLKGFTSVKPSGDSSSFQIYFNSYQLYCPAPILLCGLNNIQISMSQVSLSLKFLFVQSCFYKVPNIIVKLIQTVSALEDLNRVPKFCVQTCY